VTEKFAGWPTFTVRFVGCWVMIGAWPTTLTVSVAGLLVADPAELVTMTRYCAASNCVVLPIVKVDEVAPLMFAQAMLICFCHWYERGGPPVAVTLKLAGCPSLTVTSVGCCVMVGAWKAIRWTAPSAPEREDRLPTESALRSRRAPGVPVAKPVDVSGLFALPGVAGSKTRIHPAARSW